MKIFKALAPLFFLSASYAHTQGDFLPSAQQVFTARGYPRAALKEIPTDKEVYVLGHDFHSRATYAALKAEKGDIGPKLDNPHHAVSYQSQGNCYVKLTEKTSDKREFIGIWTGIPASFIENDEIDLDGQELGMALHEIEHCRQSEKRTPVDRENMADLAFNNAQRLLASRNLVRDTMYLRALFVLNDGIRGHGYLFGPTPTYYVAALSFDAQQHGQKLPNVKIAAEAYKRLKQDLVSILGYQTQLRQGFRPNTPDFAQVAMAVDAYLANAATTPPQTEPDKLALRAAQLYREGLNHFLPNFAQSISGRNNPIQTDQVIAFLHQP